MLTLESTKSTYPLFEVVREGSSPDIFLPTRANVGDAGHDVRVFIENEISEETANSICYGLFNRLTDIAFWQANRCPIMDRVLLIDPEGFDKCASWGEWTSYLEERIRDIRESLTGRRAVVLAPGDSVVLPAGFKVELPILEEPYAMCMKIVSRSGWAGSDQLCVTNAPGIIDTGYRKEVFIALINHSKRTQIITNEARVGQALFEVVYSFDTRSLAVKGMDEGLRGGGGSTGTH